MNGFVRSLPCEMERLSPLRQELDGWLTLLRADERSRAAIVLAAHEAAVNAIEHGCCRELRLEGRVEEQEIHLVVRADWRWKLASVDMEERGRGLQLIYGLMESVEIETNEEGTAVRMRLPFRPADDADQLLGI